MPYRLILALMYLALTSASAAAQPALFPLDPGLAPAAAAMKEGDFAAAYEAARSAPPGGMRSLLLGIASLRSDRTEEAEQQLAQAAEGFPLLKDYALLYRAEALHRLGREPEAAAAARSVVAAFPDSPLARRADLLAADAAYAAADFTAALRAYGSFIEKYPSGSDAVSAAFNSARCLENLGRTEEALREYRRIWITSPAAAVAPQAEEAVRRLAAGGIGSDKPSAEELLRRGSTQYDLRLYDAALKTLALVPREGQNEKFLRSLDLKIGEAQFRAKRYREAEQSFTPLADEGSRQEKAEALFWLARAREKGGKDDLAVEAYARTAEVAESPLADDALLQAALVRKFQQKYAEEGKLLDTLLTRFPGTKLRGKVLWEAGWAAYMLKEYPRAAGFFRSFAAEGDARDKGLFWLGRSLQKSGDREGAEGALRQLQQQFPLGYYALRSRVGDLTAVERLPDRDVAESLPVPAGMERVKALITLGLFPEASRELALHRTKGGDARKTLGLARMYLEMNDYNAAMKLARDLPRRLDRETESLWKLSYPRPFRAEVREQAASQRLPEPLIYSIIRTESNFSPTAVSPAGAVGLMQVMPATARSIVGGERASASRLKKPETNILCGSRHLKDLTGMYGKQLIMAIAAYNAGSGNVARWKARYGELPEEEFVESIPYGETREYVKKVLAAAEIYGLLYGGTDASAERRALPPAAESAAAPPPVAATPPHPLHAL